MQIKEIRLKTVKIFQNDTEIYSGQVDNAPDNIKQLTVTSMHFESSILCINV